MKTENIAAFLNKNAKKFNEEDYSIIETALADIDDSFFPSLMTKSFTPIWLIIVIIALYTFATYTAIICLYMILMRAFFENWVYTIVIMLHLIAPLCLALYLQKKVRKNMNLKAFLSFITTLKQLKQ